MVEVANQPAPVQKSIADNEQPFMAFAQKNYDFWLTLSQEDKQKDKELHERFASDPVAAMERFEEIFADFAAADADGDGLLNFSEYSAFLQVYKQRG